MLASPPYSAVIECEPVVNDAVVSVAAPPLSAAVPSTVAPSLKVTVPVGEAPVTVAVNVTACPVWLGLSEEVSAVLVLATPTPWVNIGDALAS